MLLFGFPVQDEDALQEYRKIAKQLENSQQDEAAEETIEALWDLHQNMAETCSRGNGTFNDWTVLFGSSMLIENLHLADQAPKGMSILEVMEHGCQAVLRMRGMLPASSMSEENKQAWRAWIDTNEAVHLWEYSRWLRDAQRLDEAATRLNQALTLEQESMMPWIYLRYASIDGLRGRYQARQEWLDKAEKTGDHVEQDLIHEFEANLALEYHLHYRDIGVPEQAAWWLEQGKAAAGKTNDDSDARDYAFINEVAFKNALEQYEEAMQMAEKGVVEAILHEPDRVDHLLIRWAIARTELERRNRILNRLGTDAISSAENSDKREPAPAISDPRQVLEQVIERRRVPKREEHLAALTLARIELDEGRTDEASQWLARAEEARVVDREGRSSAGAGSRSAYHAALQARLLIESGSSAERLRESLKPFTQELCALVEQLSSMPIRSGGVGFLYYDDRRLFVSELIRLHLQIAGPHQGAERAFEDLLPAQNLGSLARALQVAPAGLPEIRAKLLAAGRGILSYLPAPDRSYVLALDSDGIIAVELPSEQLLLQARSRMVRLLWSSHSDPSQNERLHEAERDLADLLLPPLIQDKLESWDEVILVGLDLLGWTPFECLPLASGKRVGIEKAVSWLPSLAVGVHLADHAQALIPGSADSDSTRTGPAEVLMLLAPEHGPALNELDRQPDPIRLSAEQVRSFKDAVHGRAMELRLGKEATEERLTEATLDSIRLLCLFAHGANRRQNGSGVKTGDPRSEGAHSIFERPATLVLSPTDRCDGLLCPNEVEKIASPPVVVLAACGAAAGPVRYGDDGIHHLGGAFFQAGAMTVLLTRAKLEQQSTAWLTALFIENLVYRGFAPARALQEARKAVAACPEYSHPFFHSMLQVVGLGHVPVFEPDPRQAETVEKTHPTRGMRFDDCLWPGGIVLLFTLAFLFWFRSRRATT
ncbi:MAG: CHAT domain-containing protein [Planctomycetota bacterium]